MGVQGLQELLKRSLGFPLEALDVQGGPEPRDVCEGEEEELVMKEAGKQPQVSPIPTLPCFSEGISEAALGGCATEM